MSHKRCVVDNCINESESTNGAYFFPIPSESRELYLKICSKSEYPKSEDLYICTRHFEEDLIRDDYGNLNLKRQAFPTKYLPSNKIPIHIIPTTSYSTTIYACKPSSKNGGTNYKTRETRQSSDQSAPSSGQKTRSRIKDQSIKEKKYALKYSCRVCLDETPVSWTSLQDSYNAEINLRGLLEFCLGTSISTMDGLPQVICKECLTKLEVAYEIKKLSLKTEKRLKLMVPNSTKRKLVVEENNDDSASKKLTFGQKLEQMKLKMQMEMENYKKVTSKKLHTRPEVKIVKIVKTIKPAKIGITNTLVKNEALKTEMEIENYQVEAPKIETEVKSEAIEIEDSESELDAEFSKDPNSPYKLCYLCNSTFTNKTQIFDHLETDHRSPHTGKFHCPSEDCKSTFLYADSFYHHIIKHLKYCGIERRWIIC